MPEFRPHLVGVGVPEVVEDFQCLPPGIQGLVRRAESVVGVTEVGEGIGLVVAVAELAEDAESAVIAVRGASEVAEQVLGAAEAVPGACFAGTVAEFAVQGEGLPAERVGLLVVAELEVTAANIVEGLGLPGPVTCDPEQGEGLLGVAERVSAAMLSPGHPAEGLVDMGLAGVVTELPVEAQAVGQVCVGLVIVGELGAGMGQVTPRHRLPRRIAQTGRGSQCCALGSGRRDRQLQLVAVLLNAVRPGKGS